MRTLVSLMKIRKRKCKKRYLGDKRVYAYDRLSLDFPAEFHNDLEPFLGKDLDMTVKNEANDKLIVILTPEKMFRHAELFPGKT